MKKALLATADATLGDILDAQVIPFDVGTLQNDATFVDDHDMNKGNVSIVSSIDYAARLYEHPEYNFQTVNNPNAKAGWFEEWIEGDFCHKMYARMLKRYNDGG